ncbi:MAG: ATP-binding cassette domain-containing protein [Candidatus Tectomicrobia bacterium]|nr:ATP-binding cassette domain-containing protein [Candidatus Tectomicrobia bacterium]
MERLVKHFPITRGVFLKNYGAVKAVDDISFTIQRGETLGLVGESGCGKSTTARLIMRLIEPTSGSIFFEEEDLLALKPKELRRLRQHMSIVYQDPFSSLNPRMTVGDIIGYPLYVHGIKGGEREERIKTMLDIVGLNPQYANRYPHQFSGGQRQRIGIARALALNPSFVVLDEPVSALDVSIQAQILNLLQELQKEFGLTYLFISHDLHVVEYMSTDVAVMYLGKICELASSHELYTSARHPYSKALLSAIASPDPDDWKEDLTLEGEIPSPANPPSGCRFRTRCPFAKGICAEKEPIFEEVQPDHLVACHRVHEIA